MLKIDGEALKDNKEALNNNVSMLMGERSVKGWCVSIYGRGEALNCDEETSKGDGKVLKRKRNVLNAFGDALKGDVEALQMC